MAEAKNTSFFRKEAMERIASPDDLDASLRITSPLVWVIVVGIVALLAGLLAWGFFGSVNTTIEETAVKVDGVVRCYVKPDDVSRVDVGDEAYVNGKKATVASVANTPSSKDEVRTTLKNDYLADALHDGAWSYEVRLEGNLGSIKEAMPVTAQITIESVQPISLAFGTNE